MSLLGPATVSAALALLAARVLWWALATGRVDRRRGIEGPASDTAVPTAPPDRPALAGFVVSGADGRLCRVLDTTGPATIAHLVALGAVRVSAVGPGPDEIELTTTMAPQDLPAGLAGGIEGRVLDHLRHQRESVSTGMLRRDAPSARWWTAARRSIAADAVAAGLARPTVTPMSLLPSALAAGAITAISVIHLVGVMLGADPSGATAMWAILGVLAARVARDALRTAVEVPHRLTRSGRVAATLISHRLDDLIGMHPESSGLTPTATSGDTAGLAMATALGVPTRLTRQVPLPGADTGPVPRHRVVWSPAADGVRPVRIVTPLLPGRGGRPTVVVATGLGLTVGATALRRALDGVADAAVLVRLRAASPDAVSVLDRVVDVARLAALAPLVLGIALAVAGVIDLRAERVTVGRVVDVRLPDRRRVVDRLGRAITGAGSRGTLLVEVAVDDGTDDRVRSWLVAVTDAAPVGSAVEVRHTPVLGRVRSIRPPTPSDGPIRPMVAAGQD